MSSRRTAETASSVLASIKAQHFQSMRRLEKSAEETQKWFERAFEKYRLEMEAPSCEGSKGDEKSPLKKKPKMEGCLPQETLDYVYSLRVRELSAILRERGLDGNGVKKCLQNRLIEALEKEKTEEDIASLPKHDSANPDAGEDEIIEIESNSGDPTTVMDVDQKISRNSTGDGDQVKEECSVEDVEMVSSDDIPNTENSKIAEEQQNQTVSAQEDPSSENRGRSPLKIVKSAPKAFSPGQQAKTVTSLVQKIESSAQSREDKPAAPASSRDEESHTNNADNKISQVSESASATKVQQKTWGALKASAAKKANPSSSMASIKRMKADRKARMEEIRNKSKPAVMSSSITSVPTLSKVKTYVECAQFNANDGRKNLLAAQMREKANAKLNGTQAVEQTKENSPNKAAKSHATHLPGYSGFSSSAKTLGESTNLVQDTKVLPETAKFQQAIPSSSNSILESTKSNNAKNDRTPSSVKSNLNDVLSPMDTYELSDREQSDSESEDEGKEKMKKRIPEWAQKAKLIPALEKQFSRKVHDPDQIFGEVQTCDLQEIFDAKKARYQRRTSSGNWTQDCVTIAEKRAYKRNEGFIDQEY